MRPDITGQVLSMSGNYSMVEQGLDDMPHMKEASRIL
jgi:hypothetical protein